MTRDGTGMGPRATGRGPLEQEASSGRECDRLAAAPPLSHPRLQARPRSSRSESCEVWTQTLVRRGFSKECIDYD